MDELNKIENFFGLQVNKQKSAIFLAEVSDDIRNEMLNITGFSLGRLPMKYLGVPLLSTRLSHSDCQPLIDKIMVRIQACDVGASINTPNIGNSALIIEELDWGGQDGLNTCENSFFGPHLGLGRKKNVIILGQTHDVELPY